MTINLHTVRIRHLSRTLAPPFSPRNPGYIKIDDSLELIESESAQTFALRVVAKRGRALEFVQDGKRVALVETAHQLRELFKTAREG